MTKSIVLEINDIKHQGFGLYCDNFIHRGNARAHTQV